MSVVLGIMAATIFLLYLVYFIKIIKGNPQALELEVLRSLADWIISKGSPSKSYIWGVFFASLVVEALYFYLTVVLIQNPVMMSLTLIFIPQEIYHMSRVAVSLNRFFSGRYLLSQIFNWRMERASAVIFFTHSFLVLAILFFL